MVSKSLFFFYERMLELIFRGGAQGIDDNIFPQQLEIDWVYFYQWQ